MNIFQIILPPLLGAIIALSTNWLAIKMLFRPHTEKRIFGIKVPFTPGLIPKERERLTKKLAEAISTRLLTPEVLADGLSNPDIWHLPDMTIGEAMEHWGIQDKTTITAPIAERAKEIADKLLPKAIEALRNFPYTQPELDVKLAELTRRVVDENISRFAGMFVTKDKVYTSIKKGLFEYLDDPDNYMIIRDKVYEIIDNAFIDGVRDDNTITEKLYSFHIRDGLTALLQKEKHAVNRVFSAIAGYLATHMPIQAMIEQKMNAFDIAEAEELIVSVVGRELKLIIWLGGLLGFIIGILAIFV